MGEGATRGMRERGKKEEEKNKKKIEKKDRIGRLEVKEAHTHTP